MDFGAFDHPQPDVSVDDATRFVDDVYGKRGNAQSLAGERDRSFLIDTRSSTSVLKVGNRADHPDALSTQTRAIVWALSRDPSLPLADVIITTNGSLVGFHSGYQLQLTEHLSGTSPRDVRVTPGFRRSLGAVVARLDAALAGFDHPSLRREFPWSLSHLPGLRPILGDLNQNRAMVEAELDRFETTVMAAIRRLPSQAIHGDLNSDNILVDHNDHERIAAVFDFGDMGWAPAVVDLAIAATYQCEDADPIDVMVQMASSHHMISPLSVEELALIPDLMAARCAQSLLMSARQLSAHPDNASYVGSDIDQMSDTLSKLKEARRSQAVDAMVHACGLRSTGPLSTKSSLETRREVMASSYRLSYAEPVHAVSAEGVWITDADGRRLLDAYNNVPHVGHGHPRVLAALAGQSRRLSTNTRYLVDEVGEYAVRLADLLPEPLSVVFFTNSGSEANDLAYRIATTVTGATAALTSANAYHGATAITAALSPEENDVTSFADWPIAMALDRYLDGSTEGVAEPLARADELLAAADLRPAMVIVDTIFSSEGIHLAAPGLLRALYAWASNRGALLVADEVQAGFGRVGSQFWGFGDVTPDLVTLGKPIGNGYPMGGVVTTREIADRFAASSTYFSTFAGSPVAAAVGGAVLDVIEDEELAARADDVGGYLKSQLAGLSSRAIVAVRGAGLFVGVELESSRTTSSVVEEMRQRGVLIGRTGPKGNVLKIRPPLVFSRHHADRLLTDLVATLPG